MTFQKLTLALMTAATAVLTAAPAVLALEDQATLPGKFTWIIPDDISSQYPDTNLRIASEHFVSELRVTRNAAGKFVIQVTLPTTLTGGQTIQSTYVQQSLEDGEMVFVNPAREDDYLRCYTAVSSWSQVRCSDVTLKGVTAIPANDRENYAQSLYEGTASEAGMMVVAGAEPGGEIQFKNPDYENAAAFMGIWAYNRIKANGDVETGTMRIDGYNGIFRADDSSVTGLLTNIQYQSQSNEIHVDWFRDGFEGYITLEQFPSYVTGESTLYPDNDYDGIWSAEQPQ